MSGLRVLGAGGWGTALAVNAARTGQPVTLWARRPEVAARLAEVRENREYLPGILLPDSVRLTSDLGEVGLGGRSQRGRTRSAGPVAP
jgi:glycerol-3-phosphate dehydrogenase (NAD(P)+)